MIETMPVEAGPAGLYAVTKAYGRPPALEFRNESMQMPNDVVLLAMKERGSLRIVKYWSQTMNDFVGLTLVE
jgi:hypothetical protein